MVSTYEKQKFISFQQEVYVTEYILRRRIYQPQKQAVNALLLFLQIKKANTNAESH